MTARMPRPRPKAQASRGKNMGEELGGGGDRAGGGEL